ncbi:phage head morphogenesis protein [Caudoviricetes sp.]|nr:phage head morphogenesis protein [Caudoviricetes sp.]
MNTNTELNKIAAIIQRLSKHSYNALLRRLANGEGAKKILNDIAMQIAREYQYQLTEAGQSLLQGLPYSQTAWNIQSVELSNRLYAHLLATNILVTDLIAKHVQGVVDAKKLSMAIYDGYRFEADAALMPNADVLPRYLARAIGQDVQVRNIWTNGRYKASPVVTLFKDVEAGTELSRIIARITAEKLKTPMLRAYYIKVLDAFEKGASQKMLNNLLKSAYYEKMRYYANRIAQTELHSAHQVATAKKIMQNDGVKNVRVNLSGTHPKTDICDYYANANLYGLGRGVYPKGKAPVPTYHPFCRCFLSSQVDNIKDGVFDKDAQAKYFAALTEREGRKVAGTTSKYQQIRAGLDVSSVTQANIADRYKIKLAEQL